MSFWKKAKKESEFTKKSITHTGNNLNIQGVGTSKAGWISWNSDRLYYKAYKEIPQLNSIINRLSDAYIRGEKSIYNKDGILSNNNLLKVLANPNPLQSKYEFWETWYRNLQAFSRVHVLKLHTSGNIHKLIVLPTIDVRIRESDSFNLKTGMEEPDFIDGYDFTFKGEIIKLDNDDVWTYTASSLGGGIDGYLYPDNRLESLLKPLSNIELNYTSRNELMKSHGAIGMISSDSKDADGTVTLTDKEKTDIQEDFKKYLLASGDYKYLITTSALKWTPMAISVKDMMFAEGIKLDTDTIADVMNYPAGLMSAGQSQTKYTNLGELRQMVYTDKVIPDSIKIDYSFNNAFRPQLGTDYMYTDFSGVEVLQSDKKETNEANKVEIENISLVNKQIYDGIITKDIGISQLVFQGYTKEDAKSLLTDTINKNISNE